MIISLVVIATQSRNHLKPAGHPFFVTSSRKIKSNCGSVFKALHFQLMIKANLRDGSNPVSKGNLLREHLMARTGYSRPNSILGVVVVCDRSLFLVPPDSDGLVSIELLGYTQAKDATPHSTMTKWFDYVTWKPVPGGLTRDNAYMSNMRRSEDPHAEWARLLVFGDIGANYVGRLAEKNARKAGWLLARK